VVRHPTLQVDLIDCGGAHVNWCRITIIHHSRQLWKKIWRYLETIRLNSMPPMDTTLTDSHLSSKGGAEIASGEEDDAE
jgi:hypothetical protein